MIDITNQRFGKLVALRPTGEFKSRSEIWECICDCGKIHYARASNLRQNTKSCGCLRSDNSHSRLPEGVASMRKVFKGYKDHAKQRHLEFSLTEEQFKDLAISPCIYCGNSPTQVAKSPNNTGNFIYNGIDRLDNSKGYFIGNVAPCCGLCNWMKRDLSYKEFALKIDLIYEHLHGMDKE